MTDTPIIFSAPMVRAILEGRKTMTRRVVKPQPVCHAGPLPRWTWHRSKTHVITLGNNCPYQPEVIEWCPYTVGMRLWVKEALGRGTPDNPWAVAYEADGTPVAPDREWDWQRLTLPGMFMPRWASRLTLEVTAVRVERVQDITLADVIAEGAFDQFWTHVDDNARKEFARLWDSLNGRRGYPWSSNPFVWVVSFRRVEEDRP